MAVFEKNNTSRFKDHLICEALGLDTLRQLLDPALISVPEVHSVNEQQLFISKIEQQAFSDHHFEKLGQGLALLHSHEQKQYGFSTNNYIGLSPQKNILSDNWGDFFVTHRLEYQIAKIERFKTHDTFLALLKSHRNKLTDFLNDNCEFPSLVHGDLWSGNALADKEKVWLIDPAVYFADREVDLAMTEMFGGFSHVFYQAYDKLLPRSASYPQKKIIYNLYHYLNHYNLFGSAYLDACGHGLAFIEDL